MIVKLNKVKYNLRFTNRGLDKCLGKCWKHRDFPNNPRIHIRPDVNDSVALDTLIHEIMHALFEDYEEDSIRYKATEMAKALIASGVSLNRGDK